MKRKFTREDRQRIVDDFASRHGGVYDPHLFLKEVRLSNGSHPAWPWFTWNDFDAAEEHRLWQARSFVQGLTVKFEVQTADPQRLTVTMAEMPAYVSPMDRRRDGGGYDATDPQNLAHRAEIARQGVTAIAAWERRYGGLFVALGGDADVLADITRIMETAFADQEVIDNELI